MTSDEVPGLRDALREADACICAVLMPEKLSLARTAALLEEGSSALKRAIQLIEDAQSPYADKSIRPGLNKPTEDDPANV